MRIIYKCQTSLLISILLSGCDNSQEEKKPPPNFPSTPLSLQNAEIDFFTTHPDDYQRQFTYTSNTDQVLTLRLSTLTGPIAGVNSALSTELQTSSGRVVEVDDVSSGDSVWKDFKLGSGESMHLTLSASGTFRDEFYEFEVEILPSRKNGLSQDVDSFEPNDSLNIATAFDLNTDHSSELERGSMDQCDVYEQNLSEGFDYTLSATNLVGSGSSTTGGLQFSITDQDSNPIVPTFDLNQYQGWHSEFSVNTTGNYFLQICSPRGTIYQNNYFKYLSSIWEPRIHWQDPFSGTDYEPNDSAALAYEIDVSEEISSTLAIGPADFVDSYLAKLYPGNRYSLDVVALNGPNRSDLSRLRLKIIEKLSGNELVPETLISINNPQTFFFGVEEPIEAIIQLYYQPTSGHTTDIHKYQFELKII